MLGDLLGRNRGRIGRTQGLLMGLSGREAVENNSLASGSSGQSVGVAVVGFAGRLCFRWLRAHLCARDTYD